MANLNGNGAPGKTTRGAIGDIYTDSSTGKKYKCVFAYRSDDSRPFECQWVEMKGYADKNKSNIEKPVETDRRTEEPSVAAEHKEETPVKSEQSPKKNYTNYSKEKNK